VLRAKAAAAKLSFKRPGEIEGVQTIARAVEEPIRQLLQNGRAEPDEMLKRLSRAKIPTVGFNAETGRLQDLWAIGVIDPVATVTLSMKLALSHARTVLETAAWDSTTPEGGKDSAGGETSHDPFNPLA